jgi:hypothetical protein
MAADVKSIDALQDWRVALINYRQDGLDCLSTIHNDVQKAFSWLDDTEAAWKRARRQAEEELVQAKAELTRREIPDFSGRMPDTTLQKKAVARAKAKIDFCDDQVAVTRQWRTRLPRMVNEEFEGPARRFGNFLEIDIARAVAGLDKQIDALVAYANMGKPLTGVPSAPSPAATPAAPLTPEQQ